MRVRCLAASLIWGLFVADVAIAQAIPGQDAPPLQLSDVNGKRVDLKDLRGRTVVLEWNNPHCPFVQKHYRGGNMQSLQKRFTGERVVWLTINSTSSGHAEFMNDMAMAAWIGKQGATPTAALMDPDGRAGRAFGARTTPQMFIIDPQGKVTYAGAIDNRRGTDAAEIKGATNYVVQALDEVRAGKAVSVAATQPYGCSVKYGG